MHATWHSIVRAPVTISEIYIKEDYKISMFRPIYLQLLVADHILHIATVNMLALVGFMKNTCKQHINI